MIRKGTRYPRKIRKGGREAHWLTKGGRTIYISPVAAKAATKAWLAANAAIRPVVAVDPLGKWFEVEVELPDTFSGSASTGWTDGVITVGLHWSDNLTSWLGAHNGWIDAPGKPPLSPGGGRIRFHARFETTPLFWMETMVDLTVESDRQGKSLTGLTVYQTPVSLPNYPYAMPADAGQLQTDLRAAGFDGAEVTSAAGGLVARGVNHTVDGRMVLTITQSGTDVTAVAEGITPITAGMNYPYSLPSQRAALQADLRAAGKTGAVITLHQDTWTIFIPDHPAAGNVRDVSVTYSPGDPFPFWDFFGDYQGEAPAVSATGSAGNVRTPGGDPLTEAQRGFARLGFVPVPPPA